MEEINPRTSHLTSYSKRELADILFSAREATEKQVNKLESAQTWGGHPARVGGDETSAHNQSCALNLCVAVAQLRCSERHERAEPPETRRTKTLRQCLSLCQTDTTTTCDLIGLLARNAREQPSTNPGAQRAATSKGKNQKRTGLFS